MIREQKDGLPERLLFKVSPVAETYRVIYDFVSGTRGKGLPVKLQIYSQSIPQNMKKVLQSLQFNRMQQKWLFQTACGPLKDMTLISKVANAANADKDRNVKFTGTWEFKKMNTE